MARTFDLAVGVPFALDPYEGERLTIRLEGAPRQMRLTISPTKGGEPIFEKSSFGPMVIIPNELVGLVEGQQYSANLLEPDGDDWAVLATGTIRKLESITPLERAGLYFLVGAKEFSTLTQGEYDALGTYDADTVYWIEETPGKIVRAYRGEYLEEDYGTPTVGDGSGWTPILTENPDGTITLSAENNLVTSGSYYLYTESDPSGDVFRDEPLPTVLPAYVTLAENPVILVLGNSTELRSPLTFLGIAPITRTALEGETIYIPLGAAVTGGKKPYVFSAPSRGVINGDTLEVPQTTFSGEVTFTITDANGNTTPGFVSVTVTAGESAVTPVLVPSVSPLYRGQTLDEADFFAEMTSLANYQNAQSISVSYQGVADATTTLAQGQSVGFTVTATNYLGETSTFTAPLITVQYDVRIVATSGNEADLDINPIVPDAENITLEISNSSETHHDGTYTRTAGQWRAGPIALAAPVIFGEDGEEVGDTLQANPGLFTTTTGNLTYTYQWRRDGVDIAGATAETHTIADGGAGKTITLRVTASDGAGGTASATSNGITIPAATVSNKVITPIGTPFFSNSTASTARTATFDVGAATLGAELVLGFIWADTGSNAGPAVATLDGAAPTEILFQRYGSYGVIVWSWNVSSGGVRNFSVTAPAVWRGYSYRAMKVSGHVAVKAGGKASETGYKVIDISAQVKSGDLIYGAAIVENSGTTGDFALVGLTEDAGALTHNTKRVEHFSATSNATEFRTMTVTPTGDGSGLTVGATWIVE